MYQHSKIYCLQCIDGYFYIGVTTNELRFRLSEHKYHSSKFTERRLYKHINNLGWDNVKIELIEQFSCNSREELLTKENEYIVSNIDDEYCLNNNVSFQTPEELKAKQLAYRQENRDKILQYKEIYRRENAEKIAEYNKEYEKNNKEKVKQRRKIYNKEHKEIIAQKCKDYAETHKEENQVYKKQWVENHKGEIKEKSKVYRQENKDKISEKGKKYYSENKEICQQKMREYREKNIEKCKEKEKRYRETKKLKNPEVSQVCETCSGTYLPHHKTRHEQSKKHKNAILNSLPQTE